MEDFLHRKTLENGKRTSGADIYSWLGNPELSLGPVKLRPSYPDASRQTDAAVDLFLEATWRGRKVDFVCELKTLSTPKTIENAVSRVRDLSTELKLPPLVVVPFLSEERLKELELLNVSGLDLCGNGVIVTPDIYAWRSGNPNRFPDPTTLKNIYSGDSSIFTRCFLIQNNFNTLAELQLFAEQKTLLKSNEGSSALRLSTSSKVVQALTEDLLVRKEKDGLRLQDPQRLMANLRKGYQPRNRQSLTGRSLLDNNEIWLRLSDLRSKQGIRFTATGIASASFYKVLSGVERLALYVDQIEPIAKLLEIKEGRAFANVELIEAEKNLSFFDIRNAEQQVWASPIQTWLELSQAGPRESEAAEDLAESILSQLNRHE
jgi:hypothetical protein